MTQPKRGERKRTHTFPLPLPPIIAVRVPAGKFIEMSFKIFFRTLRTTRASTTTSGAVNLAISVSAGEVATPTSTPRFRTVISAGRTSEKERFCWWLSGARRSASVVPGNGGPFPIACSSIPPSRTAPALEEVILRNCGPLWGSKGREESPR